MNKRCLFRGLDLVTYFNIFLFSYLTITGFKENIGLGFIFLGLTLFNIAYLFTNIRNRIKISQLNEKRIELELKMEELLSKEQKIDINLIKQKMLEGRIESEIINNFPNAKIIKNAYIPIGNELYNEIDLIIIDEKGIFIIESKNITGKILGSWDQKYLKIIHPGGKTFDLINPIDQNNNHFYALKNLVGLKGNYFRNIIVFGDNSYIDSYKNVPFYARICKIEQLKNSMNRLASFYKTKLEPYQVKVIYEQLAPFVKETEEKKLEHIKRIQIENENEI